jgi:lysophospholipase L1-like esterase
VRSVVGLGDSVPAGSACDCTDFVRLVAAAVARAQGSGATATNLAVGGETSSTLLARLADPATQRAVRDADLVLVTVGANDFDSNEVADPACTDPTSPACYRDDLAALDSTMRRVLDQVGRLTDAQVVVTGYWNVFLDGRVGRAQGSGYVRNGDALTKAVNSGLRAVAGQRGATYVDVYRPLKGDGDRDDTALLAADGDHPDAQGHLIIARSISAALASSGSSS